MESGPVSGASCAVKECGHDLGPCRLAAGVPPGHQPSVRPAMPLLSVVLGVRTGCGRDPRRGAGRVAGAASAGPLPSVDTGWSRPGTAAAVVTLVGPGGRHGRLP